MDMMEVLKWLPDAEKPRVAALEDMFGSPGWRIIQEWANDAKEAAVMRAANAQSWADNRIAYGQVLVYDDVVNMAERIMLEYATYADEARVAQEVRDMEDFE